MAVLKFPTKTIATMSKTGVSESSVWDVFSHGVQIAGKNGMVKKYGGYEIGFFYVRDANTGEYVVTYVWKRDRR